MWHKVINWRGVEIDQWVPGREGEKMPLQGPHDPCPVCGARFEKVFPPQYQNPDGTPNPLGVETMQVARTAAKTWQPTNTPDPWEGEANVWRLGITHDGELHRAYRTGLLEEDAAPLRRPQRVGRDEQVPF